MVLRCLAVSEVIETPHAGEKASVGALALSASGESQGRAVLGSFGGTGGADRDDTKGPTGL